MKPKQPSKKRELNGQPYPDNPFGWPYNNNGELVPPQDNYNDWQAIRKIGWVNHSPNARPPMYIAASNSGTSNGKN